MVDEQIAEIDKLGAVINAAERDMLKLRKVILPAPISVRLCCMLLWSAAVQHIIPFQLPDVSDDHPAWATGQATL